MTYTDIDKAEEMLKSEDIKGIIKASDLSLEFGSTGIQQTIVKTFIQQYKTQEKIITDTAKNAPQKLDKVIASLSEKISPNEDIPLHGNPDITIQFFYNLTCHDGTFQLDVRSVRGTGKSRATCLHAQDIAVLQ